MFWSGGGGAATFPISPTCQMKASSGVHDLHNAISNPSTESSNSRISRANPSITKRKYIDYDLSQLVDSKGGFLLEDQSEELKRLKSLPIVYEHSLIPSIDHSSQLQNTEKCCDCGGLVLDPELYQHFSVHVCSPCRTSLTDKYTLLTKTEVKQDYLLTDEELRDKDLFRFWERPNPRKSTYAHMKLYLRFQVEAVAFKKWGGGEGLDAEFSKREDEKARKKEKVFLERMKDLRKRTRTSTWKADASGARSISTSSTAHEHEFMTENADGEQQCNICGLVVAIEEF